MSYFRQRDYKLIPFFLKQMMIWYIVMNILNVEFDSVHWRLLMDSPKTCLTALLLNNENKLAGDDFNKTENLW